MVISAASAVPQLGYWHSTPQSTPGGSGQLSTPSGEDRPTGRVHPNPNSLNPNPNRLDHPGQLNRITFTNIDEVLPANESRQVRASFAAVAAVRRLNRYTLTAAGK